MKKLKYKLYLYFLLRKKREVEMDADTKGWATTVLANKSYSRNRRSSSSPIDDGTLVTQTGGTNERMASEILLHPDVKYPTENIVSKVNDMMTEDGWNIDIHAFVFTIIHEFNLITY